MNNKMRLLVFIGITSFLNLSVNAQSTIPERITTRMKDTLSLTESQVPNIFSINQRIFTEKGALRAKYTGTDSFMIVMQKAEAKRDSLFLPILTEKQLMLYNEKRARLVNAN